MKTERAMELLKDFKQNGIPLDAKNKRFQTVLEYQDILGQTTLGDICLFYQDLNEEQQSNFTWVNFHTLSQDSAIDILKRTVLRKYRIHLEEEHMKEELRLSNEWHDKNIVLVKKKKEFEDSRKWIFRRIKFLDDRLGQCKRDAKRYHDDFWDTFRKLGKEKENNILLRKNIEQFRHFKSIITEMVSEEIKENPRGPDPGV